MFNESELLIIVDFRYMVDGCLTDYGQSFKVLGLYEDRWDYTY